jgi:hypothetical protein
MRYLNRIIFINSAHITYAEINLDGNVHFIGTQGVGKSTLLRAILFFYNADTLKLGIPKEKKNYTDYYFAHPNSYVIYEVVRNEEKFCIVSYKSQHKVCFRFFDGGYQRDYFVSANGIVPESWDGIAQQLDGNRIFYTKRKIDNHIEFRDILYGNHDGKKSELKRYALLESREYQNIPKTIQNVFLNSKMEAEFIKQTIIMSLENDIRIDLNNYTHHLKDFDTQLTDIRKFKTPGTTAQANTISKLHIAIRYLEREKIQLAKELVWALNKVRTQAPVLKEKAEREGEKEIVLKGKLTRSLEAFKSKEFKVRGDISVYDDKLKTARKLTDDYERINISQIINRVLNKPGLEKEQRNLSDEKDLLFTQFKELSLKFDALVENVENQWNDFVNRKNSEQLNIRSLFLNFKEEVRKGSDKVIAEIRSEYKKEIENAREDFDRKNQVTQSFKLKKEGLKHKRFFEDEIIALQKEISGYNDSLRKLASENENFSRQIETLQKHWELDEKELQNSFERGKEKSDDQLKVASEKITEIDSCIENSKSSLYGWLTANYQGWEDTVGKVIDEKNVLFNSSLSPKLSENRGNFYGIEIDLDEIDKTVKTVADYEKEKFDLVEQIEGIRKNVVDLSEKTGKDKENLKRKYQPKIREKKDLIRGNEYLAEQNKIKSDEDSNQLNEFIRNAETEKKKSIESIEQQIEESTEIELSARGKVAKIEEELGKLIKAKERERDKKTEAEEENVKQRLVKIEVEKAVEEEAIQKRKKEISVQKEQELSSSGVDTKRLDAIESGLDAIKTELDFIDTNRDTVAEYNRDKRELFDRLPEFKNQKLILEKQLMHEEKKYNHLKEILGKELEAVQSVIQVVEEALRQLKEDLDNYEIFMATECYHTIREYFALPEEGSKTEKRVKSLIDGIKEVYYDKLNNRIDEIRKTITDFLGKFSEDNLFKFTKQLTDTRSFLDFAEMLSDFVEENKIERIEKEVNERFALIITTIGKQTTDLVSESGKIQSVVNKINDDFVKRNFVGVIKKIELKIDPSKNEVVQLLVLIKKFNDENNFNLGAANLFSSENQEKKNKEAIDLLKQFVKKIDDSKRDFVALSDSFELKFRIEENQNDTGWVEKLSNVGSDGTDVLVKAMVNIMLLNVFKEGASKRFKDFKLHCMMDEIGKLHPNNVRGILKFANDRNILLINSSPIENDALAFKHIYKLKKDDKSITRVNRILSQYPAE